MGSIKLPHASGNSMSIAAPATNPASDLTLTLPVNTGTSGQVLQTDGSGNLSFGKIAFQSYACIADRKGGTAHGGSTSAATWMTRELQTEIFDPDDIVSINNSNQFTLAAGTYFIDWTCPIYKGNGGLSILYDITGSAELAQSTSPRSNSSTSSGVDQRGFALISPSGSNVYEIRQKVEAAKALYGLGTAGEYGAYTIYTQVLIYKEVS